MTRVDFSNVLKKNYIERLAEVDEFEVIKEVQEYYADFLALNPDLFSLNLGTSLQPVYGESSASWDSRTFQRAVEGVISTLLTMKKKPLIRYEKNSPMSKRLAQEIQVGVSDKN